MFVYVLSTFILHIDARIFADAERNNLTHGWWDDTQWMYSGPRCGSGEDIFSETKTNPNSESAYLDTCFGHMPKHFASPKRERGSTVRLCACVCIGGFCVWGGYKMS